MRLTVKAVDRRAGGGVDLVVADLEPEPAVEHEPRLVVLEVDVRRRDQLARAPAVVPPLGEHEVGVGAKVQRGSSSGERTRRLAGLVIRAP